MALKLITGPTSEPLLPADAKAHLRVDGSDDDAYVTALIAAAREAAEHLTGRALMPQTWELALDRFEPVIYLPRPPLVSITSIKYLDGSGVLQTMDVGDYLLDQHSEPARIVPAFGTTWPTTLDQVNAVLIQYQAGYANAAAVPGLIKAWMLLHIGSAYANRESVATGVSVAAVPGVDRLLDAYRVWSF